MTQGTLEPSAEGQLLAGRDKFLAFVRRKVSDPELAEDLLQDSLLKAIQAAPRLRSDDSLIPWFYRILNNSIIDAYRKEASDANHHEAIELEDVPAPVDEQAALCECFRELLPTLKPEYAELIETLDLQGLSTDAEAARLGITATNLKVRRHRARQALRRELEATCRVCAEHHCLDCTCKAD